MMKKTIVAGIAMGLFALATGINLSMAEENWEGIFKGKTVQDEDVSLTASQSSSIFKITYIIPGCKITSITSFSGITNGEINTSFLTANFSSSTDSWSGEYHFKDIICGIYKYTGDVPWTANRYVAYPNITITPSSAIISSIVGLKNNQIFIITNTGEANLEITDIREMTHVNGFNIENNNCSGQTLAPESTCNYAVTYSPDSLGTKNTTIQVVSNDPDDGTLNIFITGIGRKVSLTPILQLLLLN